MKLLMIFFVISSAIYALNLPSCNKDNKKVFFIKSIKDWEHINDNDKEIFCIYPGLYINDKDEDKQFLITKSGTKEHPRYILLYNGNNTHPAKLSKNQIARFILKFKDASYWIVDRQAFFEPMGGAGENVLKNSSNIIFNRLYFKDTTSVFTIFNNSNNNKILNSYFIKTKWSIKNKNLEDVAAINLVALNPNDKILNTLIKGNEIVNYVDAIQLVRLDRAYSKLAKIDFGGTKIINNTLYTTDEFYTNCKGVSKKDGECAFSENGIDIKGGSQDSKNPVIIQNNIIFGYKKADSSFSDLSDPGSAIVAHYGVKNLVIKNNTIFNSNYGFSSAGPIENRVALKSCLIENNTFYSIKNHALNIFGSLKKDIFDGAYNLTIKSNSFLDIKGPVIKLYNSKKVVIKDNKFINSEGFWIPDFIEYPEYANYNSKDLHIINNLFFNTPIDFPSYAKTKNNLSKSNNTLKSTLKKIYLNRYTINPNSLDLNLYD